MQLVPQERVQSCIRGLFFDVPVLHIKEKIVDSARVLPQDFASLVATNAMIDD